jgi:hypothetical protein
MASVLPPFVPIPEDSDISESYEISNVYRTTSDNIFTPPTPPPAPERTTPPPLTRQIREYYWTDVEEYMRENPDVQECEVLTSQIQWGWVYFVRRRPDGSLERISEYRTTRDFRHPDFEQQRTEWDFGTDTTGKTTREVLEMMMQARAETMTQSLTQMPCANTVTEALAERLREPLPTPENTADLH